MKIRLNDGRYHTVEQLGPKQSITPEGFLLCQDVPIARTGDLLYADGETPLEAGPDGAVRISRDADVLFDPVTLASFEGKPVTLDHPAEFVDPSNWKALSVGVVQNVRRGEGIEDDLMLADLLITDAMAIEEVRSGLREVSNGYEADYEQTAPGRGRQLNIVGNHVALVERGRCGPRCAIGDKEPDDMKTKDSKAPRRTVWDRLWAAFKAKDEESFKAELEEAKDEMNEGEPEKKEPTGDDDVAALLGKILERLDALEAAGKATGDDDGEEKKDDAKDSDDPDDKEEEPAKVGDAKARAEILCPGIQMPTTDKVGSKSLDALKRKALAGAPDEVRKHFGDVSKLTGDALHAAFIGASELAKARNNDSGAPRATVKDFGKATSVADINAKNRDFWKR